MTNFRPALGRLLLLLTATCVPLQLVANRDPIAQVDAAPVYGYRVVNSFPHDVGAFTQGLVYRSGFLYESTGLRGQSTLRQVELETGVVRQQRNIDPTYFAEGLTEWKGRLVQLTWQSHTAFVYDLNTFDPLGSLLYVGEGWGLTHDGQALILSDGTAVLRFLKPDGFRETKRIQVTDRGVPVTALNELEYVRDRIYANVWRSDRIAQISPASGNVVAWIDLRGILPPTFRRDVEAVLNGIAYDDETGRLFVTGKLWPLLFEIEITSSSV